MIISLGLWAVVGAAQLSMAASIESQDLDNGKSKSNICNTLSRYLPGKVSYPSSTAYVDYISSYWSLQESSLKPSCVVSPTCTAEVALIVKILSDDRNTDFAIRGGGHTPWAGSANINGGVTVDLRAMDKITVSADQTVVSVGSGALWGEVYQKTDSLGLAVIGGRGSTIGVGGLTTGGGISHFSARKGFACDNVKNFEVVLAGGRVVNANARENSDLWVALKGGSNNFGIVTRFDLFAFKQGKYWGGAIIWADSASPKLLSAFAGLNTVNYDEYAALILSFSFVSATGFIASGNIEYTKATVNPPTFQPFTSLQPQYQNTMRISNQTDFVTEFIAFNPSGLRQLYVTSTFQSSLLFLTEVYTHFKEVLPKYAYIPSLQASLVFQPIPLATTSKAAQRGGNSLGLDDSKRPLVLCLLAFTWNSAADDSTINALGKSLNAWIVTKAKETGVWDEWVYLNYAASWQDPISGYGSRNKAKLQAVSRRYDPRGIFQNNVPGGYKLFR